MLTRSGLRRASVLVLAGLALASLGQAAWIHAKAGLGQYLIARAWERTRGEGSETAKPWPWADSWPVARLQVPELEVDLIVLAGGEGRTLAWGPGHLAGTARPGGPGNAVVGGHRDTHFAFLRELEVDQEIVTEDGRGARHSYRVREHFVTHERDTSVLEPPLDPDARQLTLVTCWPFDSPIPGGPERYVVVAGSEE